MRNQFVLLVLVALAVVHLPEAAEASFRWQRFGADPYAATRMEAMGTRESAFRKLGLPGPLAASFMEATKSPGRAVMLTKGDRLKAMLSKGGSVKKDVIVDFVLPPVSNGRMEYAAPAEMWSFEWQGQVYNLYLPRVCNNWAYALVESDCIELSFRGPVDGFVRWGIGSAMGPMPASECNAQRQGSGPWKAWYGECDWCIGAIGFIRSVLGGRAEIPHKYLYSVTEERQTIRFHRRVLVDMPYICLESAEGVQTCGVYMRPQDWRGRSRVEITDDFWHIDDGNCPG